MADSWITRWENLIERGDLEQLGPKGRDYYSEHYGVVFDPPGSGGDDDFDDYEADYDCDGEY